MFAGGYLSASPLAAQAAFRPAALLPHAFAPLLHPHPPHLPPPRLRLPLPLLPPWALSPQPPVRLQLPRQQPNLWPTPGP